MKDLNRKFSVSEMRLIRDTFSSLLDQTVAMRDCDGFDEDLCKDVNDIHMKASLIVEDFVVECNLD